MKSIYQFNWYLSICFEIIEMVEIGERDQESEKKHDFEKVEKRLYDRLKDMVCSSISVSTFFSSE